MNKNIFFSYLIYRFVFSERGENKLIKFEKYDNVYFFLIINFFVVVLCIFGFSLFWIVWGFRKFIVFLIIFVIFY